MELGLSYNDHMAVRGGWRKEGRHVPLVQVPPGQASFPLTGLCSGQCTSVGLPRQGIAVFGSQLHTHGAGRKVGDWLGGRHGWFAKVVTTLVRSDGSSEVVNYDPHYSAHFQEIRILPRQVTAY